MKKLLFATALLTALFLSACGSQKADSNDLANQPATRPEEGGSWTRSSALTTRIPVRLPCRSRTQS